MQSYSGIRISFTDWNMNSNEPNGDTEHCAVLWAKAGNRYILHYGEGK